jgi:2,6-dihydroxypyridine 3-monooxygenase
VAEVRAHATARLPRVLAEVVEATADPFVQVVFDLEVDQMVFGRAALVGDAGFLMRPHAAAGTAKAAANAWALADALEATDSIPKGLALWEPGQMAIGRDLVERTRRLGYASQTASNWTEPTDDTLFRLRDEGP